MNGSIIRYILGYVLKIEGLLLLLPCIVAAIYQEEAGYYFLAVSCLSLLFGLLLTYSRPKNPVFYLKEGCTITALSWIVLSLFGALPLYACGEIPDFTDALFETVSGFTTTGASILSDVEGLSACVNFWRCFTHWIGGMGVLVFILAIIPLTGGSNMNLMRAESPGPSVGKLVPKVKYTAQILYIIYLCMTVLEVLFLLAGSMPLYDALCTAFATAGTGGFGIKNTSIGGYSTYIQWVVTIFMILFGVNFNAYYILFFSKLRKSFLMEEVRYYLGIIVAAVAIICVNILSLYETVAQALTAAAFQVGSIITTTGFSTADFDAWPQTSRLLLVLLMFVGACAGSTGGGIKVSRLVLLFKTMLKELGSFLHPRSVKKIQMEGKPVEHEVIRATNVYFVTYVFLFTISLLLLSLEGKDLETTFTAVAATINNIGPGLSQVGPTMNYAAFSIFSKYVLMFCMLAGRLELFPLLILFHPSVWKEMVASHRRVKAREKKEK